MSRGFAPPFAYEPTFI